MPGSCGVRALFLPGCARRAIEDTTAGPPHNNTDMGVSAILSPIVHPGPRLIGRAWRRLAVAAAFLVCIVPAGAAAAIGLDDVASLARELAA